MLGLICKKVFGFLFIFLLFVNAKTTFASQNKFGIHILEPQELDKAAALVNSSGGDWGFVTIVIRDDDMNFSKWQDFMDKCREKHLVPLVRIATHQEGKNWAKPFPEDSQKWVDFLNSLNWPVKDRYIIVFNEPNKAEEWGGKANPTEYALVLDSFISEFKKANQNFKVLNAGFDLSASNSKNSMDALLFWQKMDKEVPGIFNKLDAWVSHSYPDHGKKIIYTGRLSIRAYQWELNILKRYFKLKKDLPVFITETGFRTQNSAAYFKEAFENFWLKDENVVAVTPFVLNYPYPPFSEFSWLDKDGNPYPQYNVIKNIKKENWWPEQEERFVLEEPILPPFMITESVFKSKISIKNTGQSILGEREMFSLQPQVTNSGILVTQASLSSLLKPGETGFLDFEIKTSTSSGEFKIGWEKTDEFELKVFAPSIIKKVEFSLWEKIVFKLNYYLHNLLASMKSILK